ncbi:MAG: VCBS repeat-containing protein, partial [Flammeovirgaceae bacterium]|nr:VCBS repeat-containing protein [Flammeovirgaceae bacterium]
SIPLNDKSTAVSISLGDVNKDGWLDMFVAGYIKLNKMEGQTIFNDPNYGATSLLMLNNGDNTFTDITGTSGLNYIHNTFQGILVDVDRDGWLDLVVAHDTGEVRTYKTVTVIPLR